MKAQTNRSILDPKLQRRLRSTMTDAELHLWQALRARQIDGGKFRRQHPFADYILDFVCLDRRLVVEVDGGQHAESTSDEARDRFLNDAGFEVLSFWNHDVLQQRDAVADEIHRRLISRKPHHPHPSPPLEGEGDERNANPLDADTPVVESSRKPHHPHPSPLLGGEGDERNANSLDADTPVVESSRKPHHPHPGPLLEGEGHKPSQDENHR